MRDKQLQNNWITKIAEQEVSQMFKALGFA